MAHGLLTAASSLVLERGLQAGGLQSLRPEGSVAVVPELESTGSAAP